MEKKCEGSFCCNFTNKNRVVVNLTIQIVLSYQNKLSSKPSPKYRPPSHTSFIWTFNIMTKRRGIHNWIFLWLCTLYVIIQSFWKNDYLGVYSGARDAAGFSMVVFEQVLCFPCSGMLVVPRWDWRASSGYDWELHSEFQLPHGNTVSKQPGYRLHTS